MHEPELHLLSSLRRITHTLDRYSRQLGRETGMTVPQLLVLRTIRALGDVTTSRVSAAVSLSQATVTAILDKLEDRALVVRYRNTEDRRIVHSRLTAQGERKLAEAPPWLDAGFGERFARLDAQRQRSILQSIELLAEMMDPAEPQPAEDLALARD